MRNCICSFSGTDGSLRNLVLDLDRAAYGLNDAGDFGNNAVACAAENVSAVGRRSNYSTTAQYNVKVAVEASSVPQPLYGGYIPAHRPRE